MNASYAEWQTYVNDRRDKRFTVLQIFCASEWAGTKDVLGNPPFRGDGLSPWNPAYWQEYEKKVQYANEQGLAVTIMGLMEPAKRYPEVADARRFARNLAARLLSNFVIFSPSFDSRYMDLADLVASSVREAAPFHLITQHPGTHLPTARLYHGKLLLDFSGLQTGAGWGSKPLSPATASRNAIEWWRLEPCHELIRNQPEDWLRRMVMAKTAESDLAVAYLPDNPAIAINMQLFPKAMRIRWFNPKTGERVSRSEMTSNSGDVSFERPAGWEDALLVFSAAGQ